MKRLASLLLAGFVGAAPAEELPRLLAALKAAPTEADARALAARIEALWVKSGSPAVALLLEAGMTRYEQGDFAEARRDFDAAVVLGPAVAEAYYRRALARLHLGDRQGAETDLKAALQRDPFHFPADAALAAIAAARGEWQEALTDLERALAIDPKLPHGQKELHWLRQKAFARPSAGSVQGRVT